MEAGFVRRSLALLQRTPLHPQWLLGRACIAAPIRRATSSVLPDVGSGDRRAEHWVPAGFPYIAVDYPHSGNRYRASPTRHAGAAQLPLSDSTVDTVLMLEVLEHVRRPRAALREAARVLSGGCLLLTMPFLYPIYDAPFDFRYTADGLRREVEAAGLRLSGKTPTLGAIETGGLLLYTALAASALQAVRDRPPALLLLPIVAVAIPLINVVARVAGWRLPPWPAGTAGYLVEARKL